MNAELLLNHYARIADAPDAISRLRRFVLDLAMRGKLVEQDPSDEPASALLKRIASQKAKGSKERSTSVAVHSEAGQMGSMPFPTPACWGWCGATYPAEQVSDVGKKVKTKDVLTSGRHPVVDQGKVFIRGYCNDDEKLIHVDVPVVVFGDHTRETKLVNFDFVVGADGVKILKPILIQPEYYYLCLSWLPLDSRGYGRHFKLLRAAKIPLPPLNEQHRIVAKVDELMALCNQLEAARAEREAARDSFALSTLTRLNTPEPATFAADARFALANLTPLTTRANQVKHLRQAILDLAVRGKLVEQDAADEPAAEQLKRISDERARMVDLKLLRREKPLAPIASAEVPFELPLLWQWSRIGDVALFTQYGTSQKAYPAEKGIPVLTMGNIQNGAVIWGNEKRIPEASDDLPSLYLKKFDLLYNRTNSAELVGKTGIYLGENDCRTFASYLIRIRCLQGQTLPEYLNMAMNAPEFRATQIVPLIKKQTGQANVNGTALKNMLVPLPPLAEQHRIVAKVDELMALCDQLEASLTEVEQTRSRLLESVLHHALEPA